MERLFHYKRKDGYFVILDQENNELINIKDESKLVDYLYDLTYDAQIKRRYTILVDMNGKYYCYDHDDKNLLLYPIELEINKVNLIDHTLLSAGKEIEKRTAIVQGIIELLVDDMNAILDELIKEKDENKIAVLKQHLSCISRLLTKLEYFSFKEKR